MKRRKEKEAGTGQFLNKCMRGISGITVKVGRLMGSNLKKLQSNQRSHQFLMGQSQPLFVYFHSFHIPIQVANIDST